MAGVAGHALGMFLGIDLRESRRLGGIYGVAAHTKSRDIRQYWFYGGWIIGMFGERSVAGLAVYVCVNSF